MMPRFVQLILERSPSYKTSVSYRLSPRAKSFYTDRPTIISGPGSAKPPWLGHSKTAWPSSDAELALPKNPYIPMNKYGTKPGQYRYDR